MTVYLKALFAALGAGLGSLYQALDSDNVVTNQEWVAIAIAVVAVGGTVWAVPNKDPEGTHQEMSVQPVDLDDVDDGPELGEAH